MLYRINLITYPVVQVLTFYLACHYLVHNELLLASALIFVCGLFLSFSLHISFHYHVHHKPNNLLFRRILDLLISVLLGFPFHFYQIQHFIHHKYDNGIEDFTSTYKMENGLLVPKSILSYSLLWFTQINRRSKFSEKATSLGFLNKKIRRKIAGESLFTLFCLVCLFTIKPFYVIAYIVMIYLGWVFIALHNYGQHLPDSQLSKIGYSYYGKFYNYLFLNNGLHYEHHDKPGIKYWDLKEDKNNAGLNKWIHLFDPFRKLNR